MDKKKYQLAKKRVKAKKEFYEHLITYLIIGGFLLLLNMVTSFGRWWFYWPLLGWSIGLIFHYFGVFGMPGVGHLVDEWEQRAIRKELRRLKQEHLPLEPEEEWEEETLKLEETKIQKQKLKRWNEDDLV